MREFARADVDRWIAWPRHRDPLWDGYNAPNLSPRQRDVYYQQHRTAPNSRQYSVDDLGGEYVGRISIRDIDWHAGASVLGISFHPERLDQGLGTDALRTFLRYYFTGLQMKVLFLDVAAFNHRAFRVYQKCGFRRSGERWGEPQTDSAGVFRNPEYQPIRHLFRWDYGLVRPLIIDMVIRREEWERLQREGSTLMPARAAR
ncbi:MAG: GNAT family N-acetyltransferase [Armatimonadota bacterium]